MAVPEQTPYSEHTGNGVTKSFALNFDCESKDHLIVLVDEIEPPIATWSLSGGNVEFTTAPASGSKITIQRNTPFSRSVDYQSYNNSFRPQSVNGDFDRLWLKLQELGVADWLMKLYVDRLHQQQEVKINDLKSYVDDRDDELRAYLMEEIRKQGVALDQLDEYYNYLMQRLAQIAVDKGWDASFVVDGTQTQKEINLYGGKKYDMPVGGYPLNARVLLDDGGIVKSTVPNNTNNPNVDMTGWVLVNSASQIVDASGKTQQEVNNISLDPNLAPLGWIQKDFNDSIVDVRKFIKKDLSNVTTGLQAAIEAAYGQTLYIPIPLKPLDTIYINQGLNIVGNRRSSKNYSTDVPALDFRSLGSAKHAIYVAESSSVIGFGMSDLTIFGNRNGGNGIKMGTDISKNMSDFSLENILIYNFTTAMEKSFVWDGLFKNLRVQSCTNGIKYISQANALLYSQCRVVGIDDMALQFINAEGIQFDACDISNLKKTNGSPITLYQSCVTMNTSYLENIDNSDSVITVGSTGEVIGSTLILNNPLKVGKNIKVGGTKAYIEINGQDRNQVSVVGSSINREVNAKVTKRLGAPSNRKLVWWNPKQLPVFRSYGTAPVVTANRDFVTLNSATAASGINLATNLVVGKTYTIRLAFRKGAGLTAVSMRHDVVNLGFPIDEAGAAPTTRTYAFVATATTVSVTWAGDLEIFGFDIIEGNLDDQEFDAFGLADFNRTVSVIRNAAPTVGTWRVGDKVESANPTTHAGWICTVAGTPGTWKQYGAIV